MRIILCCLLLTLCVALSAKGYLPLDSDDILQLKDMLAQADLDSLDLTFEKDWDLSTRFKMDSQMRVLQNPWQGIAEIGKWRKVLATMPLNQLVQEMMTELEPLEKHSLDLDALQSGYERRFAKAGKSSKALAKAWTKVLDELLPMWRQGFAALSPAEIDSLRSFWFLGCSEGEDSEKYESFIKEQGLPRLQRLDLPRFATLFEKVDFSSLRRCSQMYLAACLALKQHAQKLSFPASKPKYIKSAHGYIVFGSSKDDKYLPLKGKDICLIIDPTGNDRYQTALHATWEQPFFCLIDMAGDDIYLGKKPNELLAACLGNSVSMDMAGNDIYEGDDFSFASYLGFGLHLDQDGNDVYRTGTFSQAAALFGTYLLVDEKGNDRYDAPSQSQAFASTQAVALLMDREGDDLYYLGGKYYHAPLMPLDHRTLGQGMGFGFRPDYAGGIAILYDGAGNDRYLGGVYAQGVGYWYAMGMLIDEGGNDVYNAVYYPQGSGIHLACGMLYDASGDDAYYSRNGPGQGAGHDWGFGMLIDGAGNDAYSMHGGQGLGLSNSVGIFVDRSGDDRYERREKQNYGSGAFSRGTGSIGLFLDMGGEDSYPDSLGTNNDTWQKGTYGIGRDTDLRPTVKSATEELSEAAPLPEGDEPIEEIFAIASEWEVGSAVQRVRKARSILKDRADEAISYALNKKIATKSSLEYRALEALLKDAPQMKDGLYRFIHESDSLAAKNAIALLAGVADSLLIDEVKVLLAQEKYVLTCLSVLGVYKSPDALEILTQWLDHPAERFRYIAARSLAQINMPEARAILRSRANDPSFLVKGVVRNLPREADDER